MNLPSEIYTEVKEIRPLPNGQRFAARVIHYYVKTDVAEKQVPGSMIEFHGYTAEEAREAAENAFRSTLGK